MQIAQGVYREAQYTVDQTVGGTKNIIIPAALRDTLKRQGANLKLLENIGDQNAIGVLDAVFDSIPLLQNT
jgi:hypothetical protein